MFLVITLISLPWVKKRRYDPKSSFIRLVWKSKDSEGDDDDIYLSLCISEKRRGLAYDDPFE